MANLELYDDLIGVVSCYTPPRITLDLVTLSPGVALQAYLDRYWKQKVRVERWDLLLNDNLIPRGKWYTYYRVCNKHTSGGDLVRVEGQSQKIIERGVSFVQTDPVRVTLFTAYFRAIIWSPVEYERVGRGPLRSSDARVSISSDGKSILESKDRKVELPPNEEAIDVEIAPAGIRVITRGRDLYQLDRATKWDRLHPPNGKGYDTVWSVSAVGRHYIRPDGSTIDRVGKSFSFTGSSFPLIIHIFDGKTLGVFPNGACLVFSSGIFLSTPTDLPLDATITHFPEVPNIIRAIWIVLDRVVSILVLSSGGEIHRYKHNPKGNPIYLDRMPIIYAEDLFNYGLAVRDVFGYIS